MYNGPIKKMHLEITNRCNAACPACPRTGDFKGKLAGHMAMSGWHDLTLSDIKEIHKEVPTLKEVNLCGNFGDPAAAPDFFKIVTTLLIIIYVLSYQQMVDRVLLKHGLVLHVQELKLSSISMVMKILIIFTESELNGIK